MTYYELDAMRKCRLQIDLHRYVFEYGWNFGLVRGLLWWGHRVDMTSAEIRQLVKTI